MTSKPISTFWLWFAAFSLSLAWLLPNHAPPWVAFHGDAWSATVIALVSLWVIFKSKSNGDWHVLTIAVATCVMIPWAQHVLGLIPIFGTAWITSAYLLGFLLAIRIGELWEIRSPAQCADFIFAAVLIAALFSTFLQYCQWSGMYFSDIWIAYIPSARRFSANIGQPNILASLLLLGLIACSWGVYRKKLNSFFAIVLATIIITGIALTESRTAWLNITLLLLSGFIWRKKFPSKKNLFVALGLTAYFVACVLLLPNFLAEGISDGPRSFSSNERIDAWRMLSQASFQQPYFGFGWGQVTTAALLVVDAFPGQPGLFAQSHNIALDLILWNGYPIGLMLIACLIWWIINLANRVSNFEHLHLFAFIMILGTHAMLEYPLQYALFLLPFGMIVGTIHISFKFQPVAQDKLYTNYFILILSIIMLIITMFDYFRIESSFYDLRFEQQKIKVKMHESKPTIISLNQFSNYFSLARNTPKKGISPVELSWMRDTVNTIPSALIMYKFSANLAMNQRKEESTQWHIKLCKTMPDETCDDMQKMWEIEARTNADLAASPWPVALSNTKLLKDTALNK